MFKISFLKMGQYIKDLCSMSKDKDLEFKYGLMVHNIKANGKIIKRMGKENLCM